MHEVAKCCKWCAESGGEETVARHMDPAGHDRVGVGARVGVPASDAGGLLIPMKGKTGVLKNIIYRNSGRGGNHLERQ